MEGSRRHYIMSHTKRPLLISVVFAPPAATEISLHLPQRVPSEAKGSNEGREGTNCVNTTAFFGVSIGLVIIHELDVIE